MDGRLSMNTSRIHPFETYINSNAKVYIKRDDELNYVVIGSKMRKFTGLVPFFEANNFQEIAIEGGFNSNFILSSARFFPRYNFNIRYFILESHDNEVSGNGRQLLSLIDKHKIQYITRENWELRKEIIEAYYTKNNISNYCYLAEGGFCLSALVGAMSLGEEIVKSNIHFSHIFIDAGTGLTAMGLILGYISCSNQISDFHITLIAGTETAFISRFEKILSEYNETYSSTLSIPIDNIYFHYPISAKSFGSINKTVERAVTEIYDSEHIIVDGIYTAKHFMTAKHIIETNDLLGNILLVHAGGKV